MMKNMLPKCVWVGAAILTAASATYGQGQPFPCVTPAWTVVPNSFKAEHLALLPNGLVAVGGNFTTIGGIQANNIALWDGVDWFPMGQGLQSDSPLFISDLVVDIHGHLIVGGKFLKAGGQDVFHIARWDGSAWSDIGGGFDSYVVSLETLLNGEIVACTKLGTYKWNGSTWDSFINASSDWDSLARDTLGGLYMATYKQNVYWDGVNTKVIGVNPSGQSTYGRVSSGDIFKATYYSNGLSHSLARLDHTTGTWPGIPWPTSISAAAFESLPNGDSVVSGNFSEIEGVVAKNIARWDGANWHPLSEGTPNVVSEMLTLPNGNLLVGGGTGMRLYGCPAASCYPDCDASGVLSVDDFICFQTLFALGDPTADCDESGSLEIDDFICFQTAFAIGC